MEAKKIFFRADAGGDIGYGHFIRTLALANLLKDNFDCCFVTQTPTTYQIAQLDAVCNYKELPADERKFELFLNMLTGSEIVVLDNYFFDSDYQRKIKEKGCRLVCFAGTPDKHFLADIIINCWGLKRDVFSAEHYTRLYSGLQWAPLRPAFTNAFASDRTFSDIKHVVVSFGGLDSNNLTAKIVKLLEDRNEIKQITAIVGDSYRFGHTLNGFTKTVVKQKIDEEEIAATFLEADVAILPASTMTVEAIACKIPVICGYYIESQEEAYRLIKDSNYIIGVDDFLSPDITKLLSAILDNFPFYLSRLIPSPITGDLQARYISLFNNL